MTASKVDFETSSSISPLMRRFLVLLTLLFVTGLVAYQKFLSVNDYQAPAELSADALSHQVLINRDQYAIPYIQAESDRDAFFAMGFVQAQDRLWQMEILRRSATGQLSEIFGAESLDTDIWMRKLGLAESADNAWLSLSEEAKHALIAYSDGVNYTLEQSKKLPPEFVVFQHQPRPWTAKDSLSISKLFALLLGVDYAQELQKTHAKSVLPTAHFNSLFGTSGAATAEGDSFTTQPEKRVKRPIDSQNPLPEALLAIHQKLQQQNIAGHKNVGSNAWVVSGQFTASGVPILANDPHLGLQSPSYWYAVRLQGQKINAAGIALVGLPIVIFGQNQDISWGATNLPVDVQDIVQERVHTGNPELYWHAGQWHKFDVRDTEIQVAVPFPKFLNPEYKPLKIKQLRSVNGPIISNTEANGSSVWSLAWTALEDNDTSFEAMLRLNYARNWQEFREALSLHVAPTLNFLYADRENNIGYQAAGRIPLKDDNANFDEHEKNWQGYLPWSEMPMQYNPQQGFIVNANNNSFPDQDQQRVNGKWASPARAERIAQLLNSKLVQNAPIDVAFTQAMQGDMLDLNGVAFSQFVANQYYPKDPPKLIVELKNWNGDIAADSPAPALYIVLLRHLKKAVLHDEFTQYYAHTRQGANFADQIINELNVETLILLLQSHEFWCDNVLTEEVETCQQTFVTAFQNSVDELTELASDNPDSWRWRQLLTRRYSHTPLSNSRALKTLFERESIGDGTPDTINVADYFKDESDGYIQFHGAGFRQIFELTPEQHHYLMNSTGQSGHPLSHHFDDMVEGMALNHLHTLHNSETQVQIILTPPASKKP